MRSREFLLLALVFLGPVGVAIVAFYGPWEWAPRAAHGQLVEPPVQLPNVLGGGSDDQPRWSLVYASQAPCASPCEADLLRLRQVRTALSGDAERVELVAWFAAFVAPSGAPADGWRKTTLGAADIAILSSAVGHDVLDSALVLVVDPLGNLVLTYPSDVAQADLLEDLERLLEWSRIG